MAFLRTVLLLGLLTGMFLAVGYALGGIAGMSAALIFAGLMNFFAYWHSDRIVLAMYGAKPLSDSEIEAMVEKLAKEARIPVPKLFIAELRVPNAFATGRNPEHAAICVTRGLVELLERDEIEAVLSHEIAHIKNRDTLVSTLAATLGGAISYLAQIAWFSLFGEDEREAIFLLPLLILAPLAATIIQLAISRGREFLADRTGAMLCKKPLSLASALRKISGIAEANPLRGNFATSHLWIVNPFSSDSFAKLFSTHPPVEERVKKLEELAEKL